MKRTFFLATALAAIAFVFVPRTHSAGQIPDDLVQEANRKREAFRQASIRINDLAGAIHTEQDARAFVDAFAKALGEDVLPYDLSAPVREQVARAEFAAVHDTAKLIPEQRIADAWNHWVADIDGPMEARITPEEVHNMRDASYASAKASWHFYESLWRMPNVHAVGAEGKVAAGCRPVEALLVLHDIDHIFTNLLAARERVAKGILASDLIRPRTEPQRLVAKPVAKLVALQENPIQAQLRKAEWGYVEKQGEAASILRVLQLVSAVLGGE